jgi:hypothetical protein
MKNTENAFKWIIGLLQKNKIPYQLSGGFAARIYGSNRPLYDIDIEIPDKYFDKLLPYVKDYLVYGPQRYLDETFDLLLMTLKYQGQKIDISGCETDRLFNYQTKQWEFCDTKINDVVEKELYGLTVPVIKLQDLVTYKEKIRRPTDLEDVKVILQKNLSKKIL